MEEKTTKYIAYCATLSCCIAVMKKQGFKSIPLKAYKPQIPQDSKAKICPDCGGFLFWRKITQDKKLYKKLSEKHS